MISNEDWCHLVTKFFLLACRSGVGSSSWDKYESKTPKQSLYEVSPRTAFF